MATSKEFTVARTIDVNSTSATTELVDLSSYVDAGDFTVVKFIIHYF